jgi:hypothetical protein
MGVKVFEFLRRGDGIDAEQFHRAWREHAHAIAGTPSARRHVHRYELNHRLPEDYERERNDLEVSDTGFDGVSVMWFESADEQRALQGEAALAELDTVDRRRFSAERTLRVVTHEAAVIVDKPGRNTAEAKMLCILRRNPALDPVTFHAHWLRNHGGMFQRIDELNAPLIGYDQNHGVDPDAEFDGVTEQWFASLQTFAASLHAPAHRTDVEPDVAYMLDPASIHFIMAGRPTVVIG